MKKPKKGQLFVAALSYRMLCGENTRFKYLGERRPPKRGEWYLWGGEANYSPGLPDALYILNPVKVKLVVVEVDE